MNRGCKTDFGSPFPASIGSFIYSKISLNQKRADQCIKGGYHALTCHQLSPPMRPAQTLIIQCSNNFGIPSFDQSPSEPCPLEHFSLIDVICEISLRLCSSARTEVLFNCFGQLEILFFSFSSALLWTTSTLAKFQRSTDLLSLFHLSLVIEQRLDSTETSLVQFEFDSSN